MSINVQNFVDITSGVGGASVFSTRNLVGRFFTTNSLLAPQTFISFTNAAQVASYFGNYSEEYLRALFYFGWVSKSLTQPQSIQFARWANVALAPEIFSIQGNGTLLGTWTAISAGSFVLTMGGFTFTLSALDFSAAGSLAAVATILQTAIRAESGGGALWTTATVTYSATLGGFILVGGATGVAAISVEVGGGGTDITGFGLLGWLPQQVLTNGQLISAGAIWSPGSAAETITQTLTASAAVSNNFGSFAFLTNIGITQQNMVDAATWNLAENVLYLYSQGVTTGNVATWQAAAAAIGGVGLTASPTLSFTLTGTLTSSSTAVTATPNNSGVAVGMPVSGSNIPAGTVVTSLVSTTGFTMSNAASGSATELITFTSLEFPEMAPMMIEAATNYDALNSVQNYEFQQFPGLTPSVTTDAGKTVYDSININYIGQTQQAGQQVAFYQQGVLQGASVTTNIIDMTAYVNEIWLKDAATVAILNLLLAVGQVPANNQGRNLLFAILQSVINQGLNNGVISVGKTLTANQKVFIFDATNDPLAWYQVQNNGYWVDVIITKSGSNYIATYTLIYSKDDVIRKVVGTHTLI